MFVQTTTITIKKINMNVRSLLYNKDNKDGAFKLSAATLLGLFVLKSIKELFIWDLGTSLSYQHFQNVIEWKLTIYCSLKLS